ncbi:6-carboxytetrahydropterin synthase [Serratia marcescens]|nr:6-carboxytetrahydropterin synthase [Serratia marcescens]
MLKLFINRLAVIDFSILDEDVGLIGSSLTVNVHVDGELNQESIIMDFSVIKETIRRVIDDLVDHVLIVPVRNERVQVRSSEKNIHVSLVQPDGLLRCFISGHWGAFLLLPLKTVTVRDLEELIEGVVLAELPDEVKSVKIYLEPEMIEGARYHYSHGLKKHNGNCQRIAHGHRSAIHIYVDGKRSQKLEKYWAERWNNTYLVTEEDLVSVEQLSSYAASLWHPELIASAYHSSQGRFELLTLKEDTDILPGDTTVESLALYIHSVLRAQLPGVMLEVHAFEGIDKGAIVAKHTDY